jgi:hypothetical protein
LNQLILCDEFIVEDFEGSCGAGFFGFGPSLDIGFGDGVCDLDSPVRVLVLDGDSDEVCSRRRFGGDFFSERSCLLAGEV